jgi:hypothetical protein
MMSCVFWHVFWRAQSSVGRNRHIRIYIEIVESLATKTRLSLIKYRTGCETSGLPCGRVWFGFCIALSLTSQELCAQARKRSNPIRRATAWPAMVRLRFYYARRQANGIQRFAIRMSRLILRYIVYSKNEKNIAPRFLLQKNHTLKTRNFFCQHQNRPDFGRTSIKNGKNTKWQKSSATIKTQNAVSSVAYTFPICRSRHQLVISQCQEV